MTMVKTDPGTAALAAMPSDATTSASSIYLASAESDTGKSAIALGLLHLLAASAARVGVFRPIVRWWSLGSDDSDVVRRTVLVVPTNEELAIAPPPGNSSDLRGPSDSSAETLPIADH